MRKPAPPPSAERLFGSIEPERMLTVFRAVGASRDRYLHWDDLRYKTPPGDITHEEWWAVLKVGRASQRRSCPLLDHRGGWFGYTLPDAALELLQTIDRDTSGQIALSEEVTSPNTRDRYILSSLIEEAITSSQLEGASTERKVAKEMIKSGRAPRTKSEMMILNNYFAMQRVRQMAKEPLTSNSVRELHRIVSSGTMRDASLEGALQKPEDDRVAVYADDDTTILHDPPPADQLETRLESMCRFANGEGDAYVHPVIRAIILHFWLGYDHPFEDGNGRTARALFYWSLLNQGYWLAEYLTISKILKNAPSQYSRSFLLTETDDNDLTYFILYHLEVIRRAIDELHHFLRSKMEELRTTRRLIHQDGTFNHRQIDLLGDALRKPGTRYTIRGHMGSHGVVYETARSDLMALAERNLLIRHRQGKGFVFSAPDDLSDRLGSQPN